MNDLWIAFVDFKYYSTQTKFPPIFLFPKMFPSFMVRLADNCCHPVAGEGAAGHGTLETFFYCQRLNHKR